jgi:hypothetical protein
MTSALGMVACLESDRKALTMDHLVLTASALIASVANSTRRFAQRLAPPCAVAALLVACSGGGGESASAPPPAAPTPPVPPAPAPAAESVAFRWNGVLLKMIRTDRARPPVHARTLFHLSAAMYDAWSVYDKSAVSYLLGTTVHGFSCPLPLPPLAPASAEELQRARERAISYAAYRLIAHRFKESPGFSSTIAAADQLMAELGLDVNLTATTPTDSSAAALGNRIAECYINYGLQDGSNQANAYANQFYKPANILLVMYNPGNPYISNLDRWQPLDVRSFVDQANNPVPSGGLTFVGAEWGNVLPFALPSSAKTTFRRDGHDYPVYHDPGAPPSAYDSGNNDLEWAHMLVSKWASHLDARDGVMVDISPASMGNTGALPADLASQRRFYDERRGGVVTLGRALNPATAKPYAPQMVPRGDYARVIAEYWADGPESETPPGHWFTLLNAASKHPSFKRNYRGAGAELDALEWDVKSYFVLGGAMHDAAIAAWGIKGWYDTVRPVSAIRALAALGQRSDPAALRYDPKGATLVPGMVELVGLADPLAGPTLQGYGKIKLWTWKGPLNVADPSTDVAGVGWILAENWWPYQKANFVTPPFAGYVSGHSTFSRAAAEVITALTGDEFFPGGLATFTAAKDSFLKIEHGPSVDVTLQWATYRDAADQSSLSRIWGGIHPPIDDIPGRRLGVTVGTSAVEFADSYFKGRRP